ncbi:Nucleic acid binding protein [Hibiscus syriacus]|uniref:Nucleic acid binding protein n=1 Tax=Hibiscus syriacus TaxID=106335 RepID=A0A6A2Y6H2_HIBSY|nr:Nucleic acid binding protein [Hibiscus syriacus]
MQNALSPSLKALIAEQLFRHPDADVKVAVASCISEITRITAPDAPYNDDQMREIFQLIVSSFENLADKSSRSHTKRTSILETVAKVRSCVAMLDLECDALIIEMFQHFLNAISEDIFMELHSPILARVKRDNEGVLPIARKLAKSVLENCASKLKPYLTQAVGNLGIAYEDYGGVVASICHVAPSAVVQNGDATDKRVEEIPKESVLAEQVDHANENSQTSVVSNGVSQTDERNSLPDSSSLQNQEDDCLANKYENVDTSTVAEPDGLEGEKVVISDSKLEQSTDEKGEKSHSKSTEPSDSTHGDGKEVETLANQKDDSKDDAHPPCEDPSVHRALSKVSIDSEAKTNKRPGKEVASVVSYKDSAQPNVDKTKKESGTASDSEEKPLNQISKKVYSSSTNADGSSSRKPKDKKKRAWGKVILPEKDGTKISTRNEDEGSDTLEYGENLIGLKENVWWPKDHAFYDGVIQSFDPIKKKHKVLYDDGDVEILNLKREKWEVIKDESGLQQIIRVLTVCLKSLRRRKRKLLISRERKPRWMLRQKRGGGASSRKSKGASMRSGSKIEEDVDVASKVGSKSKNEDSVDTPKDVDTPKSTEPKVDDIVTPKATTKPKQDAAKTGKTKQEAPKVSSNSKGIPFKSGGKSDANGGGKWKSGLSKVKEGESMKENSADSAEVVETLKRKAPSSSSKGQGTDPKTVKKRREEPKATTTRES